MSDYIDNNSTAIVKHSMAADGNSYKVNVVFKNIPSDMKVVDAFNGARGDSSWVIPGPKKHVILEYNLVELEGTETPNPAPAKEETITMEFPYFPFDPNAPNDRAAHKTIIYIAQSREIRIMNTDDGNKDDNHKS